MTTMTDKRATTGTQVYRVYIRATPAAVWEAITKPDWSRRFGYGGDVEYDLRPGGAFRGYASPEMRAMGAPELAVDGEVIEAEPPHRLVQTWRMLMDEQMVAEGFTRLTYEIRESPGGVTRLTVTHELEGRPTLASLMAGELEERGAGGGWSWVLSSLKTLLETGEAMTH
jgi:uncharacterized protein YndB with AHSA1/START domain